MKKMNQQSLYIFLSTILLCEIAFADSNWNCTDFAKVSNNTGVLFSLESCVKKKHYNGLVKWKFTNHTSKPVYNVSISDKEYTLSDGKVEKRLGENIKSTILAGETGFTMPDAVNSDENYGNWSNMNDNPVISIRVEQPVIEFSFEKRGIPIGWGKVGTVN